MQWVFFCSAFGPGLKSHVVTFCITYVAKSLTEVFQKKKTWCPGTQMINSSKFKKMSFLVKISPSFTILKKGSAGPLIYSSNRWIVGAKYARNVCGCWLFQWQD